MAYRCFIICVVLCLCKSLSTSDHDESISIDCGSSVSYRDVYGIDWVGDDKYVKSGESRSVKAYDSISHVADTLRVFTTGKKNCYNIDSAKQGRVLVRASFHYGNYDGKNSPPTFALHFDGNSWWNKVNMSANYFYKEVTYVMKRDSISVCVAQTEPGQFPFITTLEVRSLESSMYRHIDDAYPLFVLRRVAFGPNTFVSYPDDPYDRIWWGPGYYDNKSMNVSSDARFSKLILSADRPPPAVFKNAITATTPNSNIDLFMGFPSDETRDVYINWYFSEVTRLEPNQTRSFRIFKDNKSFSDPILPPYGDYVELYINRTTVSADTSFSLVPTNDSTLPPLINAMEIFIIGDQLTDGTNKKDVEGLASLQESFEVLQGWSGDPCLPAPYTWDWIKCNGDALPRVTALSLGSYGLSGLLPNFRSLDALQTIDLHNNSLRGPIPDFLGTFPNLKTLNVANNQFNGTIPTSLSTKKGLLLTVAGNPDLCISDTSCQIQAIAPPPANSSIKKMKKKNLLELVLFTALIPSIIILYVVG